MHQHPFEWRLSMWQEESGTLYGALYSVDETGQGTLLDAQEFGPFDTALDVSQWFTRHWAPRARLRMR